MLLDIPFYHNRGYRCAQATMKSVLKYTCHKGDFSFRKLDDITDRHDDEITYPVQIAKGFLELGLNFRYFIRENGLDEYLKNDPVEKIKSFCAQRADWMIEHTNFSAVKTAIEDIKHSNKTIEKRLTFQELTQEFENKNPIIFLFNIDILDGRDNSYKGHYGVITSMNDENVWYHDSGPKSAMPNRKTNKKLFESARDLCWFDHGIIIVDGIQSGTQMVENKA
ncbi:MAG: hypothetical protein V1802_00735 [Candidatus Aenigmatarchaeota archaeon]